MIKHNHCGHSQKGCFKVAPSLDTIGYFPNTHTRARLYNGWNHLTMLGLKLIHVSKRDPWRCHIISTKWAITGPDDEFTELMLIYHPRGHCDQTWAHFNQKQTIFYNENVLEDKKLMYDVDHVPLASMICLVITKWEILTDDNMDNGSLRRNNLCRMINGSIVTLYLYS